MRFFVTFSVVLLATLISATPTPVQERQTVTKPYQLRAVQSPIFHFYMQTLAGDKTGSTVVLGPESTSEYFHIGSTVQSVNTTKYLNINAGSTSYKSLSFGATANTTAWGLEGDTLITVSGSTYGRQLNFLACPNTGASGYYTVYLQTGSDVPSGQTCSNYQTLHLPCLC